MMCIQLSRPIPPALPTLTALLCSGCLMVPAPMIMDGHPADGGGVADAEPADASDAAAEHQPEDDDHDSFDGEPPEVSIDDGGVDGGPDNDGRGDGGVRAMPGEHALQLLPPPPPACPATAVGWLPGAELCVVMEPVEPLPQPRAGLFAVTLDDGAVWVGGGATLDGGLAETWILPTPGGAWVAGPPLDEAVLDAVGVALPGGEALVVGGRSSPELARATASSAVQRLVGDAIESDPPLSAPRAGGHAAHRLGDGRVVVLGGPVELEPWLVEVLAASDCDGACPETDPLGTPRARPATTVDADGALWVLGGRDDRGRARFAPERLRPGQRGWESLPGLGDWAFADGAAATVGGVPMFAGGRDTDGAPTGRVGRFDPEAGAWRTIGSLNCPRAGLSLTPLGEGSAVVTGGHGLTEVLDPVDEVFYAIDERRVGGPRRAAHAAVGLPDGGVLVVGGETSGRATRHAFALRLITP